MIVLLLLAGACTADATTDVHGVWLLESFDGVVVEPGVNTPRTPWMEIGESIDGNLGCNYFAAAPQDGAPAFKIEGDQLRPAEVFAHLVGCEPSEAEEAFRSVFGSDAIEMDIDGDHMTWKGNGTALEFVRTDARPPGS